MKFILLAVALGIGGIEVHNEAVETAGAGQRTALNLAGVEAREITRGMTLATPGWFESTAQIDAARSLLPRAPALKHRARVHFHSGTAETLAEVALLDGKTLLWAEKLTLSCTWRSRAFIFPATALSCASSHRSPPLAAV